MTAGLTRLTGVKNKAGMWADAEARIDDKAREVRTRFATPGMDGVYVMKRDEAVRFLDDTAALPEGESLDMTAYPYLSLEGAATGQDFATLAQTWVIRNAQYAQAGSFIEAIRIAAKAEARSVKSQADINAVVATALAQLDEIGPKPPPSKRLNPIL